MQRPTNRRRSGLGEFVSGLVRPRCADCGAVGCVTWGHQYQPLVCRAESQPAIGRPELRAIDVNSRGVHVGRRAALFRRWHRV